MKIRVDAERLRRDFDALAAIGSTLADGVERIALTPAHLEARAWFLHRAADAGLDTSVDAAGNHSAILRGARGAQTLLLGSHLDTVPNGGRYDGALGVVAALEVLRVVQEARLELPARSTPACSPRRAAGGRHSSRDSPAQGSTKRGLPTHAGSPDR